MAARRRAPDAAEVSKIVYSYAALMSISRSATPFTCADIRQRDGRQRAADVGAHQVQIGPGGHLIAWRPRTTAHGTLEDVL